jgi:carotenoid cleavage dioxygenase-like enzyme
MLITKLRIDGQVFFLPEDTDIPVLKQLIVAAVRTGAEFVEFDTHGHGSVSVLMTQQIPVRFEVVDRTEDEVASWVDVPPAFEYDALTDLD